MNDTGMTDPLVTIEGMLHAIETRTANLHAQLKDLVAENKAMRAALVDADAADDGSYGSSDDRAAPRGQSKESEILRKQAHFHPKIAKGFYAADIEKAVREIERDDSIVLDSLMRLSARDIQTLARAMTKVGYRRL